jgi:hypothetical protein
MTKQQAIRILKKWEKTDRGRDTVFWGCLLTNEQYIKAAEQVEELM